MPASVGVRPPGKGRAVLDAAPPTRRASDPAAPLSSAQANALFENLHVYRDDGSVRLIQCARDPGIPGTNWLDTEGHTEGVWTLRYLHAQENPLPRPRVVPVSELASLD